MADKLGSMSVKDSDKTEEAKDSGKEAEKTEETKEEKTEETKEEKPEEGKGETAKEESKGSGDKKDESWEWLFFLSRTFRKMGEK